MLSKAIFHGIDMVRNGEKDCSAVISEMSGIINAEPLARIDYVKIVDCSTMQIITTLDRPALCAIAVYIGNTRLIDNFFTQDVQHGGVL